MKLNKAQQEMVGFVLIVVIIVVIALVFLLISVRNPDKDIKDVQLSNMISAILATTTDCSVVEPELRTFADLITDCLDNRICKNLNIDACTYLNSSLMNITLKVVDTESRFEAYQVEVFQNSSQDKIFEYKQGNCTGTLKSSSQSVSYEQEKVIFKFKYCTKLIE